MTRIQKQIEPPKTAAGGARSSRARFTLLLAIPLFLAVLLVGRPQPLLAGLTPPTWCDTSGQTQISLEECLVLEELYTSTAGDGWFDNSGWLAGSDICGTWTGILCGGQNREGAAAVAYITAIDLSDNNLSGTIPASLGSLSFLEDLSLGHNMLTGPIPPELGQLSALQNLDLGENMLSGAIPHQLASLSSLSLFFYLDGNQLSGPIPEPICSMSNTILSASFDYNKLNVYQTDAACDTKYPDWFLTQTVPPSGVTAVSNSITTVNGTTSINAAVTVSWTIINYTGNGGSYEVFTRHTGTNAVQSRGTTSGKTDPQMVVNIAEDPTLFVFFVRTNSGAHPGNQSALVSENSSEAQVEAVAVRMLDIDAAAPLLYVPVLAPLILLLLTAVSLLAFRRR